MARKNLTASFATTRTSSLAACIAVLCVAQAHAQTPDRQDCVTRMIDGKPQVFCVQKIINPPPEPKPKVLQQKPEPKMLWQNAPMSAPTTAARPQVKRFGSATTAEPSSPTPGVSGTSDTGIVINPIGAGRSIAAPGSSVSRTAASLKPVRALIEPAEMPPRGVAGYGVVAFTTRSLPQSNEREKFVCEAYKATLIPQNELPAGTPLTEQMVTYWPILNKSTPQAVRIECAHLVENYALQLGLEAIKDADKLGERLASRRGPFLIAWAPSESRFKPDAVVLIMDLSSFDSQTSFVEVFQDWRQKIVDNPQLWTRGFDVASLRRTIRDTFDRYGEGLVRLIKGGS